VNFGCVFFNVSLEIKVTKCGYYAPYGAAVGLVAPAVHGGKEKK